MPTSADASFPFNAGSGAAPGEDGWSEMFQYLLSSGVLPSFGSDVRASLGTLTDNLQVFGDSSGMQIKVKAGRIWIAGHLGRFNAQTTLAIASNGSGNPRIDRAIARLDKTDNAIVLDVLPGTPAGSPSVPSLTVTDTVREVSLAQIAVASGAVTITAGNATDDRVFAVGLGGPKAEARLDGAGGWTGYNIASLSNPAAGRFLVTWRKPFTSTAYRVHATARFAGARHAVVHEGSQTATQCEIRVYTDAGALADPNYLNIAAFGDWA